jgi:hypothetical protein
MSINEIIKTQANKNPNVRVLSLLMLCVFIFLVLRHITEYSVILFL